MPSLRPSVLLTLSLAALPTTAQETKPATPPPPITQTVEVLGKQQSDTEARRQSTAPTLVFGREELDRHGDTSVLEVMKRLPGVTLGGRPGRGGGIGMRGMGGYTQILINGEQPRGISLDSIAPEQVERIEVTRAATAEQGTRAIAGTINVVLREDIRKLRGELRAGAEIEDGHWQPGVMLQRSDRIDNFGYNLTANAHWRSTPNQERIATSGIDPASGDPVLLQDEAKTSESAGRRVNLNARLNWRLAPGETLNVQPMINFNEGHTTERSTLSQSLGPTPQDWFTAASRSRFAGHWKSLSSDWQGRLWGGRGDLRANLGQWDGASASRRIERDASGSSSRRYETDGDTRDGRFGQNSKLSFQREDGHSLVGGYELEYGWRDETLTTRENGLPVLVGSGDNFEANSLRLAGFIQDDWEISPRQALNLGLRWESIRSTVDSQARRDRNTSRVLSPVLNALWRLDDDKRDQLRFSLARTYRQVNLFDLIERPRPNAQFPVSGANDATHPDRIGNAALRPEVAWGLDLAFEHFMDEGGLFAANVFGRRIDDLIRGVTALESVSWSPVPRWVTRPRNLGQATSYGIELEAKGRLDRWLAGAPAIDVRANFSRFWSRVDSVPGPDNRIEQQPEMTANLGFDYRIKSLPLALGGNFNWTPGYDVRRLESQYDQLGAKRQLEVFAVWTLDPLSRLRFSAANLLHEDYLTSTRRVLDGIDQTASTLAQTQIVWGLRYETRL